jgi:uncharacterized membrane protein
MTLARWLTVTAIALVVSLGLNLFLGGVMLGRGFGQSADGWGLGEHGVRVNIERILKALPDADRRIARARFADRREAIAGKFAALREARRAVGAAMGAEPFEAAVLATAFATVRERTGDVQASLQAIVVEVAPELSPEARAIIAEGRWR